MTTTHPTSETIDGSASEFSDWLAREMPPGTVISDPRWWAPRIAARFATPGQPKPAGAVPLPYSWVPDEIDGDDRVCTLKAAIAYGDACEAAGRAVAVPRMEFTLREAKKLVAFFGGHDTRVTVELHPDRIENDRMHFAGMYAHCTEYPDEGAEYLGPVEVQDEDDAAPIPQQPAAEGGENPLGPTQCPITGRKFFSNVEHPDLGMVATYGGPFDSYTIPQFEELDNELRCERYDWDADHWVEGGEPVGYLYAQQQPDSSEAEGAGRETRDIELAETLIEQIAPYTTNGGQFVVDSETAPIIVDALRCYASPTPAADAGGVTEEMVERAVLAYEDHAAKQGFFYPGGIDREQIRAALTAALTPEVRHG